MLSELPFLLPFTTLPGTQHLGAGEEKAEGRERRRLGNEGIESAHA